MDRVVEKLYMEEYQIFDKGHVKAVDMAIRESEAEVAEGAELMDAREVLEKLKRKYIG